MQTSVGDAHSVWRFRDTRSMLGETTPERRMEFKNRTIQEIADMICGNFKAEESFFRYRSSSYLTDFFQDCGTDRRHDGSS
jgi:hypothetical protein